MLKRSPIDLDDDDDDTEILRQQEEYFRQKADKKLEPAAKLIKPKNVSDNQKPSTSQNDSQKMEVDPQNTTEDNIQDQLANTFEAIPTDMKLNHITENKIGSDAVRTIKFDANGFPKAIRRDPDITPKRGSIFSQHIKRLKKDDIPSCSNRMDTSELTLVVKEQTGDGTVKSTKVQGSRTDFDKIETTVQKSSILSANDKKTIHDQNLKILNSMSEEEIIAEREKIMTMMDPALVQFLKSQRSANKEELENRNKTIKEQNKVAETVKLEELEVATSMLSRDDAEGWLHFTEFEANKLAWMKDISVPVLKEVEGFEARFDFEGFLQPYTVAQIDEKNRHLYHHGDEPERPGYSLQELLQLSRSTVIQQRIVALNTLANILGLEQTGIYDKVIDIPIEQVFFVLRVCMDDNTPSVLTAAIKALRNLIYFQLDETCLDNMMSFGLGLVQPLLAVDQESEDDNTVNDQQLAEKNLVKCLARTDILTRIRYIVTTIQPSSETIIYCIEVLTRLARDSDFILKKLLQCDGLLSSLIKSFLFIPGKRDNVYSEISMPFPQMFKLIRVLSSRNRSIAAKLVDKFNLMEIVEEYLSNERYSENAMGMKLQVETLRYWTLLVHYGIEAQSVRNQENLLKRHLDYHFKHTDNKMSITLIRQSHASALLILLAKAIEKGYELFTELTAVCFSKWMSQFIRCESFKCGNSQISSAVLFYASVCNRNGIKVYDSEFLRGVLSSRGFDFAVKNILNGSLLLNNYETHKTTENLKTLEAATWFSSEHIVPVLQSNSCMPLLYALSSCILYDKSTKVKIQFLNQPSVLKYTEQLKNSKYYFNVGNWFTRCESFLIMNILKIAQRVQDNIDPSLYYDIAVKGLSVFSSEQKADMKYVLDNIVFCPRFYSIEVAMANANVTDNNTELSKAWKHLDDIRQVYTHVLGVNTEMRDLPYTSLTLDISIGNVIPVDWIYSPLVLFYSNQQNLSQIQTPNEQTDLRTILNCLRWVLIYETYFESLAKSISPTEKYVRLGCLFLGSDSLFLHEEIQRLIEEIGKFLLRNEDRIDFEQEISGLTNFKDFFVQLLEQYQAVSYGNKVFGNLLLFPLMKRHDVKYRETLWSEYRGVVETFTVKREEVWINPDDLIDPPDTNLSLCACYNNALISNVIPRNSIMYEIALKNVMKFRDRMAAEKVLEGQMEGGS